MGSNPIVIAKLYQTKRKSRHMAKVITEGVSTWGERRTCAGCGSLVEYDQDDIRYSPGGGDMREHWPASFHVKCPVCDKQAGVSKDDLPLLVQKTAELRHRALR